MLSHEACDFKIFLETVTILNLLPVIPERVLADMLDGLDNDLWKTNTKWYHASESTKVFLNEVYPKLRPLRRPDGQIVYVYCGSGFDLQKVYLSILDMCEYANTIEYSWKPPLSRGLQKLVFPDLESMGIQTHDSGISENRDFNELLTSLGTLQGFDDPSVEYPYALREVLIDSERILREEGCDVEYISRMSTNLWKRISNVSIAQDMRASMFMKFVKEISFCDLERLKDLPRAPLRRVLGRVHSVSRMDDPLFRYVYGDRSGRSIHNRVNYLLRVC